MLEITKNFMMKMNEKMLRLHCLPVQLRVIVPTLTEYKIQDENNKIKIFHLITTSLTNSDDPKFGLISAKYNTASTCEASH